MHANVGDKIIMQERIVGSPLATGEIVEVKGSDGQPPYLVRFADGSQRLIYPGPDTQIISSSI